MGDHESEQVSVLKIILKRQEGHDAKLDRILDTELPGIREDLARGAETFILMESRCQARCGALELRVAEQEIWRARVEKQVGRIALVGLRQAAKWAGVIIVALGSLALAGWGVTAAW